LATYPSSIGNRKKHAVIIADI